MSAHPHSIFVYGATGTIGRPLVKELLPAVEDGAVSLRLGVRDMRRVDDELGGRVDYVLSDLNWSVDALTLSLMGSDTLFLLTGYTSDMIAQSERAIEAVRRAGIRHVVHLGAHAAADTQIEHLQWHLDVERLIERSSLNWTHLRPNWLMQNVLRSVMSAPDGVQIEAAIPADRHVSWVDADDIGVIAARVLRDPARHQARTYMLAPECRSFHGVAEIVSRTLNIPCEVRETSVEALTSRMIGRGEPTYARSALHYMQSLRAGGSPECADTHDIDLLLGRQAVSWPLFVARHRDAFCDQRAQAAYRLSPKA